MARAFGPTPGRPYIGPPRPFHDTVVGATPQKLPPNTHIAPRGYSDPGGKLFGGQYTRAEVIQRYKRFGGPKDAIAAYKRRLDRQRKGIYLGQSSGTSSGQGSGSASGRGGTSVGSGPKVPKPSREPIVRQFTGGPNSGKPNLAALGDLLTTRSAVAAAAGKTSPPAGNDLRSAVDQRQRQLALQQRQRQLRARRGL